MRSWNAIALFCEDIRVEKAGTVTVVGFLPDNVEVSGFPIMFPRLGIYTRIQLNPKSQYKSIRLKLRAHDSDERIIGSADEKLLTETLQEAQIKEAPFAGIVIRFVANNYSISGPGKILIHIEIDKEEALCGFLNIKGPSNNRTPRPSIEIADA